jgi:alpha-ketoglutarate-dependent taurine dioxygenase
MLDMAGAEESTLTTEVTNRVSRHGYVYVHDVPDSFDHADFIATFGDFMPQYDGKLIWDIKAEAGMDDIYHSRNTRSLVPHTEAYEFSGQPPRYLALWCVKRAAGEGGATTIADGYELLKTFSEADRELMYESKYEWHSSDGLARKGIHFSSSHPILEKSLSGRTVMRYSYNNVTCGDDDALLRRYIDRGAEFFEASCEAVYMDRNGMLIWDNWRMLHSRTAFQDRERHLKRVLIAE